MPATAAPRIFSVSAIDAMGKHHTIDDPPQMLLVFPRYCTNCVPLHVMLLKGPKSTTRNTKRHLAKKRTRAARIAKTLKRTEGATRQKAFRLSRLICRSADCGI